MKAHTELVFESNEVRLQHNVLYSLAILMMNTILSREKKVSTTDSKCPNKYSLPFLCIPNT